MGSGNPSLSSGPVDSRLVRLLFYVGDGAMAGAILYLAVGVAFRGLSAVLSDRFATIELVALAFVLVLAVAIGARNLWATLLAGRSVSNSPVYEEWIEVRRSVGVVLVAILIAGVLVVATVLQWGAFTREAELYALATLGLGLLLRVLVRRTVSRADGSVFPSGTRLGLVGFLVLLVGLAAVLTWGGARMDALIVVFVAFGGYVLMYLVATAELE